MQHLKYIYMYLYELKRKSISCFCYIVAFATHQITVVVFGVADAAEMQTNFNFVFFKKKTYELHSVMLIFPIAFKCPSFIYLVDLCQCQCTVFKESQ